MVDKKNYLFLPDDFTRSDLRAEYPELFEVAEFKKLQPSQIIFAYALGCRSSSLHELYLRNKDQAIEYALSDSGLLDKLSPKEVSEYRSNRFSDDVRSAVKRFERFSPSRRLRAKIMREINFNSLEKMAHKVAKDIDASMDGEDAPDIDKYKSYSDFIIKTNQSLNEIVTDLEAGFGISEEQQTSETGVGNKKSLTAMEKVLMEEENDN